MDAKYMNPFMRSTVDVMKTMCFVEPKMQKPFLRNPAHPATGYVSGIMGVVGELTGTIALSFEKDTATKLVSNFMSMEITELNDDVIDAVGELINMVSGAAKKIFADEGIKFNIAIPTVVSGKNHTIHHVKDLPCIVLPFEIPEGKFFVEASFKASQ